MLLQTDRYLAWGASTVSVPAAGTLPRPRFSDRSGRDPADSQRFPSGARLMDHNRWLVGLQFHTVNFQPIWLYYVVDEASDTTHAMRVAIQRAASDPDRVAGGVQAEAEQVEVQQLLRDALGRFSLTLPANVTSPS